jgi:hypothetical protein
MQLIAGKMLTPVAANSFLSVPYRILYVDVGCVWCIALPHRRKGRPAGYLPGPIALQAGAILAAIERGEITDAAYQPPTHWAMTDADYLACHLSGRELARRAHRIHQRKQAWAVVAPIVKNHALVDLLQDAALKRALILQRARECKRAVPTVYRLLHLYWASGSVVNGLMPVTNRCGAPGKERHPHRALGRPPKRLVTEPDAPRQRILTKADKRQIGVAYALTGQGCTRSDAFAQMNNAFYSDAEVGEDGNPHFVLRPTFERPTRRQFGYWGRKLTNLPEFREENGLPEIPVRQFHRGGSSRELAEAIGESAQFDATSGDVYLTSLFDRQAKLSPPTRSIIIEQRSGVILAPLVSWEHPSSSTFLQAVLLGASDKVTLCARYGITIGPDDWPGMLCRKYFTDNGEARTAEVLEAGEQLGFDLEFAPSYKGAAKGDVESKHHADHRGLDHMLPGTTRGRRRERGEKHPALSALWNYDEYMREYLLLCIARNNAEDPKRAPTEMLVAGIRPTHINILKWLINHGQRADIQVSLDVLRAWTLPTIDAVIERNGIFINYPGTRDRVHELRFMCDALRSDPRFIKAGMTGHVVPTQVRFQGENLRELWLPRDNVLLRVPNVSSDRYLLSHGTLADLAQHHESEAVRQAARQQSTDQAEAEVVRRRTAITENAATELKRQHGPSGTRVSKAAQLRNLKTNATREQAFIQSRALDKPPEPPALRQPAIVDAEVIRVDDAASAAAASFAAGLKGAPNEGG